MDWRERFGRKPKDGARPLLILWPFGPVALVYDIIDTEGKELPQDVQSFFARGPIGEGEIAVFRHRAYGKNISGTMSTQATARPARSNARGGRQAPRNAMPTGFW
jgi:hypothetical protein